MMRYTELSFLYTIYTHLLYIIINNNNGRLVTLAEHTSDHGKQANSSTKAKGEQG